MIRRFLQGPLAESLQHFPVVLLTGARQVGKSTLAQAMISKSWPARYLTLDDRTVLDAALQDTGMAGFLAGFDTWEGLERQGGAGAMVENGEIS